MSAMTEADWEYEYRKQHEREMMQRAYEQEMYEEHYVDYTLTGFLNDEVSEGEARLLFSQIRHPSLFEQYVLDIIASGRVG